MTRRDLAQFPTGRWVKAADRSERLVHYEFVMRDRYGVIRPIEKGVVGKYQVIRGHLGGIEEAILLEPEAAPAGDERSEIERLEERIRDLTLANQALKERLAEAYGSTKAANG